MAVPGAAELCAVFTITVANGEMNLFFYYFIFYSLDLLFGLACFDSENSIFYFYFYFFSICKVWPPSILNASESPHVCIFFFIIFFFIFLYQIFIRIQNLGFKKATIPSSFIVS